MIGPGWRAAGYGWLCSVLVGATSSTFACSRHSEPSELRGPKTYHAVGVIKSFGPGRAFLNIVHEDIPGYMNAMTMSFDPQRPAQLDRLSPGDKVDFEFVETEDARRVLSRIDKR